MSTVMLDLGDFFFGRTRGRILALLFGSPDESFFVREIARKGDIAVGAVQRELKALAAVGLSQRSSRGNLVFYQANRGHPAFQEVHALIVRTFGAVQQVESALLPLAERISFAFIFGSMARGDADSTSDLDLMVIGQVSLDEVLAPLVQVERIIGRPINPTVYSLQEFGTKLAAGNHFLRAVAHGKKRMLIGDEDELGQVG